MPQIKSAMKRVKTIEKANNRNASQLSTMRSAIKKFKVATEEGSDQAADLSRAATRAIDMAETKGLIHANKAGRDKSRLNKMMAK